MGTDLKLDTNSGIFFVKPLNQAFPNLRLVLLTSKKDDGLRFASLRKLGRKTYEKRDFQDYDSTCQNPLDELVHFSMMSHLFYELSRRSGTFLPHSIPELSRGYCFFLP